MSILTKDNFNFIPEAYLEKEKIRKRQRMVKILLPILILMLILPVALIYFSNQNTLEKIDKLQEEQKILLEEVQEMELVESNIAEIEGRISIFSDLLSNSYKRVTNIRNIEKYIPKEIIYTKISLLFSDYTAFSSEEIELGAKEEAVEEPELKIYENVPNIMVIEGKTRKLEAISRFVYQLNHDPLMEVVNMEQISWLEEEKINSFLIIVEIKEDVLK